jgi:hypothetical protein
MTKRIENYYRRNFPKYKKACKHNNDSHHPIMYPETWSNVHVLQCDDCGRCISIGDSYKQTWSY